MYVRSKKGNHLLEKAAVTACRLKKGGENSRSCYCASGEEKSDYPSEGPRLHKVAAALHPLIGPPREERRQNHGSITGKRNVYSLQSFSERWKVVSAEPSRRPESGDDGLDYNQQGEKGGGSG